MEGFSLIEVVIAMVLMAVLMLGILAAFGQSLVHGARTEQLGEVRARAQERMEELSAMPFDAAELEVPAGKSELVVEEAWIADEQRWVPAAQAGQNRARFRRRTRVRNFDVSDLLEVDSTLQLGEQLVGGQSISRSNLKEIEVQVRVAGKIFAGRSSSRAVTLRLLRAV